METPSLPNPAPPPRPLPWPLIPQLLSESAACCSGTMVLIVALLLQLPFALFTRDSNSVRGIIFLDVVEAAAMIPIVQSMIEGMANIRLVKYGYCARGEFFKTIEQLDESNGRSRYANQTKYVSGYFFDDMHGLRHLACVPLGTPWPESDQVIILYDAVDPERNYAVNVSQTDASIIGFDASGQIQVKAEDIRSVYKQIVFWLILIGIFCFIHFGRR